MNKEILYEDKLIRVVDTGRDYDFIAYIENKTKKDITIQFENEFEYELEDITVGKNDWVGLLANDNSIDTIHALQSKQFHYE